MYCIDTYSEGKPGRRDVEIRPISWRRVPAVVDSFSPSVQQFALSSSISTLALHHVAMCCYSGQLAMQLRFISFLQSARCHYCANRNDDAKVTIA